MDVSTGCTNKTKQKGIFNDMGLLLYFELIRLNDGLCGSAVEERLYVSDAFHDVKIEVTEDGTKAAATTGEVTRVLPGCVNGATDRMSLTI